MTDAAQTPAQSGAATSMTDESPAARLIGLITGYRISQAIHVVATLGIADLLRDGPCDSAALAAGTGAHPPTLYRLLRALAAVGVFREAPLGHFALAPMGDCLRSDAAEPVGPLAVQFGQPYHWQPWSYLLHAVRTGENAFRHVHGIDSWTYRAEHPEDRIAFDRAMTAITRRDAAAIVAAVDFRRFRRVVDVGGGQGRLLAAILSANDTARGVLFDLPEVVAHAADVLRDAGVAKRCEIVGGSFFETIPAGGDAYVLKSIIHDWGDAEAARILLGCRRAVGPEGRVLIVERMLAPPNEGAEGKLLDLQMLVGLDAKERTSEEFAALLDAAGFELVAAHAASHGLNVLESVPR